jgi:membrane associated rhomboid family serine protease
MLAAVLTLAISNNAVAQQSTTHRKLFTIAGAGGGFTVGLFTGLAKFDDAINSDRKVWTAAIAGGAGGAVGGYFLGRALDKRRDSKKQPPVVQKVAVFPIISKDIKGINLSISF